MIPPAAAPTVAPASAEAMGPAAMNGPMPGIDSDATPATRPRMPPTAAPAPAPFMAPDAVSLARSPVVPAPPVTSLCSPRAIRPMSSRLQPQLEVRSRTTLSASRGVSIKPTTVFAMLYSPSRWLDDAVPVEVFTSWRATGMETGREALADGNDESSLAGTMYLVCWE